MSWERRLIARAETYGHRGEVRAARQRSELSPQGPTDQRDLDLAEEQRRLEREKEWLEEELKGLEKTAILMKADLQCQIEWRELQIEAARRQRQRSRVLATTSGG